MVKSNDFKLYAQSREEAKATYIAQILDALDDLGIDIFEIGGLGPREVLLAAPFGVGTSMASYYVYLSLEDLLDAKRQREKNDSST